MVALKKLHKNRSQIVNKLSKSIPVADQDGNKHILRATVFTANVTKNESNVILEDENEVLFNGGVIQPPLPMDELSYLPEISSELPAIIKAKTVGIDGFGITLRRREYKPIFVSKDNDSREVVEDMVQKTNREAMEERSFLDSIITYPNPEDTFEELKRNTRCDLLTTGNAYWELIPQTIIPERTDLKKPIKYNCYNKLTPSEIYITKADKRFTKMRLRFVTKDLRIRRRFFKKKFRRFIQFVNQKKVFFKEFGDPRVISKVDGRVIAPNIKSWLDNPELQEKFPKSKFATELYHFKNKTAAKTPYGVPDHIGNIIAINGSRTSEEINIITQQNMHIPSMAILVSGGALTNESVERIQEFADQQISGDLNHSKYLLLEGEGAHDGLSNSSSVKVEIKPLTENQHKEELWQDYDQNNIKKLRRSHRQSTVLLGETEGLSRSTASEAERLSEKYVYNPERESFDQQLNKIFMQQGFKHWVFESNSPNITNTEDIVKILTGGDRVGGVTPRIAHIFLNKLAGFELPPLREDDPEFDLDVPFSLSLARAATKSMAEANRNGTMTPSGQVKRPRNERGQSKEDAKDDKDDNAGSSEKSRDLMDKFFDDLHGQTLLDKFNANPTDSLKAIEYLKDMVEDTLDLQVFGSPQKDYFDGPT